MDTELKAIAGNRTENDTVAELAASAAAVVRPVDVTELIHGVVLPPGHTLKLVDLELHRSAPGRKREHVELHTAAALAAYVNRHKVAETTTLYADAERACVVAVLNDSSQNEPGWGDHRAELALAKTQAWLHWEKRDGKIEGQDHFAAHIEGGLAEIVDPPAAEMMEVAQTIIANLGVAFKSAKRLRDGRRQLQWDEEVTAKAGEKGELEIPAEFTLMVAPYEGSAPFEVRARLKYRVGSGSLQIGYELVRPKDILRAAFTSALVAIEEPTGIAAFLGTPPVRP